MGENHKRLRVIERKLLTTFLTTSFVTLVMAAISLTAEGPDYMVDEFIVMTSVFFLYIGAIILLYGNAVSFGLEYAQKKWFKGNQWLYVLLHGIFGLAVGIIFPNALFAIACMSAALLYALVDWLLLYLESKQQKTYFLAIIPIILFITVWGTLEILSPQEPPFTKEDAVKKAAADEGLVLGTFPEKIGKAEGTINGFRVTRESAARVVGKGEYLVVFTETWEKGKEKGSRSITYLVDEYSVTAQGEEGEVPSYYFDSNRVEKWTNQTFD